jgi:hypothetical protein
MAGDAEPGQNVPPGPDSGGRGVSPLFPRQRIGDTKLVTGRAPETRLFPGSSWRASNRGASRSCPRMARRSRPRKNSRNQESSTNQAPWRDAPLPLVTWFLRRLGTPISRLADCSNFAPRQSGDWRSQDSGGAFFSARFRMPLEQSGQEFGLSTHGQAISRVRHEKAIFYFNPAPQNLQISQRP